MHLVPPMVLRFAWPALLALATFTSSLYAAAKEPPAAEQPVTEATAADLEFFEKRIRPILVRHCYECHSAASVDVKGGLKLDTRQGLLAGGESGPAIVPGRPDESLLIDAVRYESLEMPPAGRLPAELIDDLKAWIVRGAVDPRDEVSSVTDAQQAAWQAQFDERVKWWSLQPLTVAHPPLVPDDDGCRSQIDAFVSQRLAEQGLRAAVEADRVVLVRRLSFALTGLPPSPDEVELFVEDSSPVAAERLVDRLLASPHYGERWARHWMDVVRYSDTYGYEWDIPAKGSWRYRDYLIRGFNSDVPFDQLVREQIAGDLIDRPRIDPLDQINESLAGVMFYQMGEKRHGDSAEFNGIHQEMLDNKIDAFSKAFQAMTVSCSRCHDHRLDPVSQHEYYGLAGVFMSSRWVTNTLDTAARHAEVSEELREIKTQLRRLVADRWLAQWRRPEENRNDLKAAAARALEQARQAAVDAEKKQGTAAGSNAPSTPLPLESPFYPWVELVRAVEAGGPCEATWQALADEYAAQSRRRSEVNASRFEVVADFSQAIPSAWSVDGVGLWQPAVCGDFTVSLQGPQAVGQLLAGGLYTHSLSPRLNGAVRSPPLNQFGKAYISFEACGGDFSAHRTVVDNAFLTERQVYLSQPQLAWVQLSTFPQMQERRIYVEFATKTSNPNFPPRVGLGGECSEEQAADPRSWFGLRRVWVHDEPGPPADELTRYAALFSGDPPENLAEAAEHMARWLRASLEAWRDDRASSDDVQLINWMIEQGLVHNDLDDSAARDIALWVGRYRDVETRVAVPQTVNGMRDMDPGIDYRLNVRGDYDELGDAIPRGYLRAVTRVVACGGVESESGRFASAGSGRLELAELVASPRNPLTARVLVNRCWHWLLGAGLVETPDNFGRLGGLPSHPELLDHLAGRFLEQGWSTKRLVRSIVLSRTWRQAGRAADPSAERVDPTNRLLHHFPLRRLEAEAIRDAMLAVSGRLDRKIGGPPVLPNRQKEDAQKRLFSGPVDGDGRRSIYTMMTIMEPPRFLATFNQPSPKVPTGKRDVTNTPLQSLALLNDPLATSQADGWARRSLAPADCDVEDRIRRMFRAALARDASADEIARWTDAVRMLAAAHQVPQEECSTSAAVWKDIAHMLLNTKEFIYVR